MKPPPVEARILRIAHAVVWASTLLVLAIGLWEIAAPVGAGHFAVNGSRGIIADNMLAWKIITPVRSYLDHAPQGGDVYAHHPWGTFWLVTFFRWLLGRHDFIPRLYPVLMNVLLPGMFFGLGRALWGTVPGALCALGWAVMPIVLSFVQFPGFEIAVVFACIWVSWGCLEYRRTGHLGWGLFAVLGCMFTPHTDWIAAAYAVGLSGLALIGMGFGPAKSIQVPALRKSIRLWTVAVAGLVLGTAFYVREFKELGQFNDWLNSAEFRAAGNTAPLELVLRGRQYWLEVMFTEVGIAVMLIGAALMALQLLLRFRFEDFLPLGMLGIWVLHYVHFKNGADIHIYWPLPMAAHFALSLGVIASWLLRLQKPLLAALKKPGLEPVLPLGVLVVTGCMGLAVLPDAIRAVNYARNSGGRFNEHGRLIHQDFDKTLALRFFARQIPNRSKVAMDSSMQPNWAQEFALNRPIAEVRLTNADRVSERYRTLDSRFASAHVVEQTPSENQVTIVGPFWLIDKERGPAPVEAFRFAEREPTWYEWLFVQAHDPIQSIIADPWATWEWRWHLGQSPNPAPVAPPRTADELRIKYNIAISQGDITGALKYRDALSHMWSRPISDTRPSAAALIGLTYTTGVLPRLTLYFEATRPLSALQSFEIQSVSRGRAPASFVMPDELVKSHSLRLTIPPALWKPGMLYASVSDIRQRPGPELFDGNWTGEPRTRLIELP